MNNFFSFSNKINKKDTRKRFEKEFYLNERVKLSHLKIILLQGVANFRERVKGIPVFYGI